VSLSYKGRRAKGQGGELEAKKLFAAHGWTVRGLEAQGDHMATRLPPEGSLLALHLEIKRQERLRIVEWTRQAMDEAPEGVPPVVCYRRSNEQWMAVLPLADLLDLLDG
jgi:hypothetical protein